MRIIRYFLWIMVGLATASFAYLYFFNTNQTQTAQQTATVKLGGEFSLLRHDGSTISDTDMQGKPHAVFFGFTNCPEVCPTTLFEMSGWLEELGEDADRIDAYFMTVDPERDTVAHLSEYLTSFDSRIIGITGEKSKVERALKSFKVYFNRVEEEDGEYSMDHTATIYLLNGKNEFVGSIAYGEDAQSAIAKLRNLLN